MPPLRACISFLIIATLEVLQPFRTSRTELAQPLYFNPPANWRLFDRPLPIDYHHEFSIKLKTGTRPISKVKAWLNGEGIVAVHSADPPVLKVRMPAQRVNRLLNTDLRTFVDHEGHWQVRSLGWYTVPEPYNAYIEAIEGLIDFPPGPITVVPFFNHHAGSNVTAASPTAPSRAHAPAPAAASGLYTPWRASGDPPLLPLWVRIAQILIGPLYWAIFHCCLGVSITLIIYNIPPGMESALMTLCNRPWWGIGRSKPPSNRRVSPKCRAEMIANVQRAKEQMASQNNKSVSPAVTSHSTAPHTAAVSPPAVDNKPVEIQAVSKKAPVERQTKKQRQSELQAALLAIEAAGESDKASGHPSGSSGRKGHRNAKSSKASPSPPKGHSKADSQKAMPTRTPVAKEKEKQKAAPQVTEELNSASPKKHRESAKTNMTSVQNASSSSLPLEDPALIFRAHSSSNASECALTDEGVSERGDEEPLQSPSGSKVMDVSIAAPHLEVADAVLPECSSTERSRKVTKQAAARDAGEQHQDLEGAVEQKSMQGTSEGRPVIPSPVQSPMPTPHSPVKSDPSSITHITPRTSSKVRNAQSPQKSSTSASKPAKTSSTTHEVDLPASNLNNQPSTKPQHEPTLQSPNNNQTSSMDGEWHVVGRRGPSGSRKANATAHQPELKTSRLPANTTSQPKVACRPRVDRPPPLRIGVRPVPNATPPPGPSDQLTKPTVPPQNTIAPPSPPSPVLPPPAVNPPPQQDSIAEPSTNHTLPPIPSTLPSPPRSPSGDLNRVDDVLVTASVPQTADFDRWTLDHLPTNAPGPCPWVTWQTPGWCPEVLQQNEPWTLSQTFHVYSADEDGALTVTNSKDEFSLPVVGGEWEGLRVWQQMEPAGLVGDAAIGLELQQQLCLLPPDH